MSQLDSPKILYFDIETSLMEIYSFYIGDKVNINYNQIKEPKKIICIAYLWGHEKDSEVKYLTWNPAMETDDRESEMLKEFNRIAGQADYLVGHNAQQFDVKELRTEIALRGHAEAWCETPVIDTLKMCQRTFRFVSNKLDYLLKAFGRKQGKYHMSLQNWIDVQEGVGGALEKMVKYCCQDVRDLRFIHSKIDYYVPPTASELRLKNGVPAKKEYNLGNIICLTCKDPKIVRKYGRYKYGGQDYQKYICQGCSKVLMPEKPPK